jgi:UDP-galactopyranose mutase
MTDLIVVGCGLFGMTVAEQAASAGLEVQVLEKRATFGGNAYSYFDSETNIEIHKYGSHLFHTNNERVWSYVNKFTTFNTYQHRVLSRYKDRHYSMPINLRTINDFYGKNLSPNGAKRFIADLVSAESQIYSNLEEKAISLVGKELYEALIYGYTKKQWQVEPNELPAEVITRLPFRYSFRENYFEDKYQGLPVDGYGKWFERMLDNPRITVTLESDFKKVQNELVGQVPIVYTGPIDEYFDFQHGRLNWRTLDFETSTIDVDDFQGAAVINYPEEEHKFTRIHEFKHLHPERMNQNGTVISKEYSRFCLEVDEPFYPTNLTSDKKTLQNYRQETSLEMNVYFGGRLGSYQYLDMHMAIAAALNLFENKIKALFHIKETGK